MRIETYGQQLEITPALRDYVEEKLRRLDRHFDQPIAARVQLGLRKPSHRAAADLRSEEHTSELQSRENLVCRLLLEKKKKKKPKKQSTRHKPDIQGIG